MACCGCRVSAGPGVGTGEGVLSRRPHTPSSTRVNGATRALSRSALHYKGHCPGRVVEQLARRRNNVSRLTLVTGLGILSLVTAVSTALPAAAAQPGIQVFVGYADILRADATTFPTPWDGSPQTTFEGCAPSACTYDAGAVRVVNNTGSTVTVNAVKVHVDTCTYGGGASATHAPGAHPIPSRMPPRTQVRCAPPPCVRHGP